MISHYTFLLLIRLCLLGSGCDMFQYYNKVCSFMPHNPLKGQNLFRVLTQDPSNLQSIFVLECSVAQENIIYNNDLATQSYEGKICFLASMLCINGRKLVFLKKWYVLSNKQNLKFFMKRTGFNKQV